MIYNDYGMSGLAKIAEAGAVAIGCWIVTLIAGIAVGLPLAAWWIWHHVSIH